MSVDHRTPQAKKWADDYLPPETCGSIDDVQNDLEHLRDANSQLRHAAHFLRHRAEAAESRALQAEQQRDIALEALEPFASVCIGRESMSDAAEIEIQRTAEPLEYGAGPNVSRARLFMREFRKASEVSSSMTSAKDPD